MGFFKKGKSIKQGKVYTITETLEILSKPGYENYTTEETSGGYKIIGIDESKILEKQIREKQEFYNRMNGNGSYRNIIRDFKECPSNPCEKEMEL